MIVLLSKVGWQSLPNLSRYRPIFLFDDFPNGLLPIGVRKLLARVRPPRLAATRADDDPQGAAEVIT
jgi:hypothetical protein